MAGEVCFINIGKKERAKRMMAGIVGGAVSLAVAGGLLAMGLGRWWRLVVLLPASVSALVVFQATGNT